MGVLDRAAATCILTLFLGCLHVIALKSKLFTRFGGLPYPTENPISYETLYFDQKVSLKSLLTRHLFLKMYVLQRLLPRLLVSLSLPL